MLKHDSRGIASNSGLQRIGHCVPKYQWPQALLGLASLMGLAPVITGETAGFVGSFCPSQAAGHMAGWDAESWERGLKEAHLQHFVSGALDIFGPEPGISREALIVLIQQEAVAACLVPVLTWTILDCFSLLNIPIMLKIVKARILSTFGCLSSLNSALTA